MSKLAKTVLKNQAMKIYKENAKKVPKRNRMPFSAFFKQYVKYLEQQKAYTVPAQTEVAEQDFDFTDMAKMNEAAVEAEVVEAPITPEEK